MDCYRHLANMFDSYGYKIKKSPTNVAETYSPTDILRNLDELKSILPNLSLYSGYAVLTTNDEIERVIFNNPATIVYWKDGTKTVVKCGENDNFDKEKGLAMCICKKLYGNTGSFNEVFKKWIQD